MTGIITDNIGRSGGLIKAAGGGGKLLQVIKSTDKTNRSQTGNYSFTEMSNTLGIDITPTASGNTLFAFTSDMKWYSYGASSLALFADSTELDQHDYTGSAYSTAGMLAPLVGSVTASGTSQVSFTIQLENGGNSAGEGGMSFAESCAWMIVMELAA